MRADNIGFVSLADALRSRPAQIAPVLAAAPSIPEQASAGAPAPVATLHEGSAEPAFPVLEAEAISAARVFAAALADALDTLLDDLVREIAGAILGRELRLAEVDLAQIARRLIAERLAEHPVRLHVAPSDAAVACELPVVVDPALVPGDAVLECRTGSIDARLGIRLAALLAGGLR